MPCFRSSSELFFKMLNFDLEFLEENQSFKQSNTVQINPKSPVFWRTARLEIFIPSTFIFKIRRSAAQAVLQTLLNRPLKKMDF